MVSGHNDYGHGYAATEVRHHEWRTAENSSPHLIPKLQAIVKVSPKIKLLDVGAGSGTISASLAKYMPEGEVTATDISDEILARAKEYAQSQGVSNIKFQQANVFKLPFPDAAFDVTHAHQVLCHLDAPVDAIREMLRVTKPRGTLSLRESDMHMWCIWPELPALLNFHELQVKNISGKGGQDKGGRQLLSWVLKAGVSRSAMKDRSLTGFARDKAIEMGNATGDELDEMAKAWEEWIETDDASLGIMNGEALITKK
ncbi:delta-24-sterol methyltransferase [Fusarium pseudoanthophilum]|uniref:Delta-24-sterol methyltransferase n=1 Tax=Fusarium pseudoanthophilum TaxID=48495 RepID=A0A8H5L190_9HYPO|nr:delta-24-sterol methyltransferase [Fusarium pseudoanthophilum]